MNKIGKIGRINFDARRKIATQCFDLGIETCEIRFPGCMGTFGIAPAHKQPREWYRTKPELLYHRDHWRAACQWCHEILDNRAKTSKEKSDSFFEL